ncbi:BBP7 family outer membrane beta-barrel protein [Stieleria sp. JC731]|uniref:BBP7 family outer membrane beta-barrel protein n=1 Tax=Pirellulaceae TaxID=2691357 RepID=UPI001E5F4AE5|nr:BBP7 family outer membrane beta-barrel protein [Stieleria sp. JC731]MCC9600021.1 BBP7 family outer membrane beta-barrel protein [Stieleria sp. JC731]
MKNDATGHRYLRALLAGSCILAMTNGGFADGLIRKKTPDRQVYQPPTLVAGQVQAAPPRDAGIRNQLVKSPVVDRQRDSAVEVQGIPLPVVLAENPVDLQSDNRGVQTVSYEGTDAVEAAAVRKATRVATTKHAVPIHQPITEQQVATCGCQSCQSGASMDVAYSHDTFSEDVVYQDSGYDLACDAGGCDSMGCDPCGPSDWFGSVELLLMFRNGDHLPPLVTTDQLDASFEVLSGAEKVFDDMTVGGRLTLGMWLDPYKDRSVVGRLWFAGEETYDFTANDSTASTFGRPFFDVELDQQGFQVIAEPGIASGEVSVHADSQIFGGDVSIRQLWYKNHGATVDLLYGYQYMRVEENLTINSRSTSLSGVDAGAILSLEDAFEIQNDFHGAQIGVSSFYREGCWSVSTLAKAAFGNTRRRVDLSGNQTISIDGDTAQTPSGLLVRDSNSGVHDDNTFGWVPELDLTLGWQRFPSFDVTFGYHIIAMTHALRPSGVIDPELGTDLSDATNRPLAVFRKDTVYLQGLHFGLSYIY